MYSYHLVYTFFSGWSTKSISMCMSCRLFCSQIQTMFCICTGFKCRFLWRWKFHFSINSRNNCSLLFSPAGLLVGLLRRKLTAVSCWKINVLLWGLVFLSFLSSVIPHFWYHFDWLVNIETKTFLSKILNRFSYVKRQSQIDSSI